MNYSCFGIRVSIEGNGNCKELNFSYELLLLWYKSIHKGKWQLQRTDFMQTYSFMGKCGYEY